MQEFKPVKEFKVFGLKTASQRIARKFLDLLESQFTLRNTEDTLMLKFPGDYASALFIHINHLNKCLKDETGKTTSQHIVNRKMQEAKLLLQQSNLPIETIGNMHSYVAYFNRSFRNHTGVSPGRFRKLVKDLS